MTEMITMGTCDRCGGPVQTPRYWASVTPPPITCAQCGAQAARHGPVIPMQPARKRKCEGPCFCTGACESKGQTGTMFIGPGLVPYEANDMTQLDPETAQILADNLWGMYYRSGD